MSGRCGALDVALRAWALSCRGQGCGGGLRAAVALALLFAVRVALSRLLCCLGQGRERGMSDRCGALDVALRACGPVL